MNKIQTISVAIVIASNILATGGCRMNQTPEDGFSSVDTPAYYVELHPLVFDTESSAAVLIKPLQLQEYQVSDILRASLDVYPLRPVSAKTVGLSSVLKEGLYTGYPGIKIRKSEINSDKQWVYPIAAVIRFAPDLSDAPQPKTDNVAITVSVDYMAAEAPRLVFMPVISKEYSIGILPDSTIYMLLPVGSLSEIDARIPDNFGSIHLVNRVNPGREYLCYLLRISQGLDASTEETIIWTEEMHSNLLEWMAKQSKENESED